MPVFSARRAGSDQGRRHDVLIGGRFHRHRNSPIPKFNFSSDFGHFILKMLENAKFEYMSRTKLFKFPNFWGYAPADFSTAGTIPPSLPPPAFGAHGSDNFYSQAALLTRMNRLLGFSLSSFFLLQESLTHNKSRGLCSERGNTGRQRTSQTRLPVDQPLDRCIRVTKPDGN